MTTHKILYQSGFDPDGILTYRATCKCGWICITTDRADWMQVASEHVEEP